ncbi:MAG: exodeoxyribonuclease V subunit alpha [Acidimicrobiales bacterium]|nr:exodeoxyribonuclease V subunit alpha [Acidimicrobiales bacterium]
MNGQSTRIPESVTVLEPFVAVGVFDPSEVQFAATVARLRSSGEQPPVESLSGEEILALAVAARGPRLGHVCVELDQVAERVVSGEPEDLPWPDPAEWARVLDGSDLVLRSREEAVGSVRPLVWDGRRLYLHRYEAYERAVAEDLAGRCSNAGYAIDVPALDDLFPAPEDGSPDRQRVAAEIALTNAVSVIAGGPGTGKTRTVARVLAAALLTETSPVREFALAAPTGKAAARMTEAVRQAVEEIAADGIADAGVLDRMRGAEATTIHRLLGARPGAGFARDRHNPLIHDLVVVDETSMVDLPLMARLLDAVRPTARVVLVGDPDQLASVEAGTVLADLVGPRNGSDSVGSGTAPLAGRVTILDRVHRFGSESGIAALADAVRAGDVDSAVALLDGSRPDLRLVPPESADSTVLSELVSAGVSVVEAARSGDGATALRAAAGVKVLAATHRGSNGRRDWDRRVERVVLDLVGDVDRRGQWHIGRPVLVTANDPLNGVFNGDTGVAVSGPDGLSVALPSGPGGGLRFVPPARLHAAETWWSMTIHKSQGSEFPHVVVALPTRPDSPVLTRELLYTAITRARERVTIVATEAAFAAAVLRPVARASGLADRLWP